MESAPCESEDEEWVEHEESLEMLSDSPPNKASTTSVELTIRLVPFNSGGCFVVATTSTSKVLLRLSQIFALKFCLKFFFKKSFFIIFEEIFDFKEI